MKNFKFLDNLNDYHSSDAFVAHLPEVKGKDALLKEMSLKLCFPAYFGFNWDALSECLKDFHWIKQKGIILVHDEIPLLEEKALEIYIQILVDALFDWKDDDKHYLEVLFPKSSETQIGHLIRKLQ